MQDFSKRCQKIWSWYDVCRLEFDMVNYHRVQCIRGYLGHSAYKYLWIDIHASYKVSRFIQLRKEPEILYEIVLLISVNLMPLYL